MAIEEHISKPRRYEFFRDPKNGIIGGVCAGVAETLDIDFILARVAAVVLFFMSFGIAGVLYCITWILLPARSSYDGVVDVEPVRVTSELYDRVVNLHNGKNEQGKVAKAEVTQRAIPLHQTRKGQRTYVAYKLPAFLFVVLCALVTAALFMLDRKVDDFQFIEFAPFYLVPLGIFLLTAPDPNKSLSVRLCLMIFCFEVGTVLLPFSIGMCNIDDLLTMSSTAFLFWFAMFIFLMGALVFDSVFCYVVALVLLGVAAGITFLDLGIFDPMVFFSSVDPELSIIPVY